MTARAHEDEDFPLVNWKFGQGFTKILQIDMVFLSSRDRQTIRMHALTVLHLSGALAKIGIKGATCKTIAKAS